MLWYHNGTLWFHSGFMVEHCGLMVECCDFVLCLRLKFSLKKEILLILLCKKRCHCLLLVTMLWFVDVDLLRLIVIDLQWVIVSIVSNELRPLDVFSLVRRDRFMHLRED